MESAYYDFIKSNYLPILEKIKEKINANGKDFTHEQFASLFKVSRKTFELFYNGKLIRFDLLIELGTMYEYDFELTLNP